MLAFHAAALFESEPMTPSQIKTIGKMTRRCRAEGARRPDTNSSMVEEWVISAERRGRLALRMLAVVKEHGLSVLDSAPPRIVGQPHWGSVAPLG